MISENGWIKGTCYSVVNVCSLSSLVVLKKHVLLEFEGTGRHSRCIGSPGSTQQMGARRCT